MKKQKNWQIDLNKEANLAKSGRENLYERVKILISIEKDAEFLRDNKGSNLPQFFNERLADTCATFAEAKAIMKLWPKSEQWRNGNLAMMRLEMLVTLQQQQRTESKKKSEKNGVSDAAKSEQKLSWKEKFLNLEMEYKQLKAAHEQLEKDYREMRQLLGRKAS